MSGYNIAKKYLGKHENVHTKELDNFIRSYVPAWKGLSVSSTPWCAGFVNACERASGSAGNGKLNARSFNNYADTVYDRDKKIGKINLIKKGDIATFERGGSSWQGHVAYVDGVEITKDGKVLIRTLGGNQSDSVSIGWYPLSRLLTVRRSK